MPLDNQDGISQRKEAVRALQGRGVSIARACKLLGYNRSNLYYVRSPKDDAALKARMHELAQERPRWGWRRLFIILRRREGYDVGKNAISPALSGTAVASTAT